MNRTTTALRRMPATMLNIQEALVHIHLREAKEAAAALMVEQDRGGDVSRAMLGFGIVQTDLASEDGRAGVMVGTPMVGFNAYEVLREGDVLLAIRWAGGLERTPKFQDLGRLTFRLQPGDPVELYVLRGGRVANIEFRMDHRIQTQSTQWFQLSAEARRRAEEVWKEQVVPVLAPGTESQPGSL